MSLLLGFQVQHRNEAYTQHSVRRRQRIFLLMGFGGVFGTSSAAASAVLLGMMIQRAGELPVRTFLSTTTTLIVLAFIAWAVSLLSEASFLICTLLVQRAGFQEQQAYDLDCKSQDLAEMTESVGHRSYSMKSVEDRGTPAPRCPPTGRPRAASDGSSICSFSSHAVRPISSKTKLIPHNHISLSRSRSVDSGRSHQRETVVSIEEGFDSWDTSAVDAQAREAVASASSASSPPARMLETIPASPPTSRSGSPTMTCRSGGRSPELPSDLEPPRRIQPRNRSYSPANSFRERPRTRGNQSPEESTISESHIHPLFRTASCTPPPAVTPGTIVTAAPGAGQIISERGIIRPVHLRMMSSGSSKPPSPRGSHLVHAASLESIRQTIVEYGELEPWEEDGGERTITPPIPDFILNGGPRNSMLAYSSSRKKPAEQSTLDEAWDARHDG